jgi:hypothetical protein
MWAIMFFPSIVLTFLWHLLFPNTSDPPFRTQDFTEAFLAVTIGPLLETLLLALFLGVLSFVIKGAHALALVSAVFWAVMHSLAWPPWGVFVAWSFYVMSRAFMAWFEQRGLIEAVWVTTLIHSAVNFIPALALLFG